MEDALLNIRQAMFEREDLVCGQLQLIETEWKNCGYVNLLIDLCFLLVICCYLLDWSFLRVFFPLEISH